MELITALGAIAVVYYICRFFYRKTKRAAQLGKSVTKGIFGYVKDRLADHLDYNDYYNDSPQEIRNIYWDNPVYSPHTVFPEYQRDPLRFFHEDDVHYAKQVAHYQCEHVDQFGYRCPNTNNLQADHWYPHSRGGATAYNPSEPLNMFTNNLVILCADCNRAKSNKPPTQEETLRLLNSRSGYNMRY